MKIWGGITQGNVTKYRLMNDGNKVTVRDATARLALPAHEVEGVEVLEGNTGALYRLVRGGDPTDANDWVVTGNTGSVGGIETVLLDAVTANGVSAEVVATSMSRFTAFVTSADVVLGAFVRISCLTPEGNWVIVHEENITDNDTRILSWDGAFRRIRAEVSGYSDGTYTVSVNLAKG
jgi:hypothetical protein